MEGLGVELEFTKGDVAFTAGGVDVALIAETKPQ
jgi:hypothetical protein